MAPELSIVIPVYNEEATVQDLVRLVVKAPLPQGIDREIAKLPEYLQIAHDRDRGAHVQLQLVKAAA